MEGYDPDRDLSPEAVLERMEQANRRVYATLFSMHFGSDCHAFLEFCGLMSKYTDLCRGAHHAGIDFTQANAHNGQVLPMNNGDVLYLAEKFDCIFGSYFRANPDKARLFAQKALGLR